MYEVKQMRLLNVLSKRKNTREHEITYYKPYMAALRGKKGRMIIDAILNTPPADFSELHRRSEECIAIIMADSKNGKHT